MYLIRVTDHDLANEFISLPARLSRQHKGWSKSQQKHIKTLINRKSPFFEQGKAEFWILTNFRGETIGRIAAFVEHPQQVEKARGFIGLFDCINHLKAASLLFDECKEWLKRFGVRGMNGPITLLPFQLEGITLEGGFQQSTSFFSAQAVHLSELYTSYGFKISSTQQLMRFNTVSSLLKKQDRTTGRNLLTDQEYELLKIKKSEIPLAVQAMAAVYKNARAGKFPTPSDQDIEQWLQLLFSQHLAPLIWIAYFKQKPIAFFINTYISSDYQVPQHVTVWQQLASRFSSQQKSLLNLACVVHPDFRMPGICAAFLNMLEESLSNEPASDCDSFLMMSDCLESLQSALTSGVLIDKFVKFQYQFDQETLNSTFAEIKTISRK